MAIDGILARILKYGFAPIGESDKETFLCWCIYHKYPFWQALEELRSSSES